MRTTTLLWPVVLLAAVAHCKQVDVQLAIPGNAITVQLKPRYLLYPAILNEINKSARRCCTLEPSAEALQNEVRRYLAPKYAIVLSDALNQRDDPALAEAQRFFKYLRENFRLSQVVDIFKTAIDEIYNEVPIEMLAAHLHRLYAGDNAQSYDVIAQSQLYLYWKFIGRDQANSFDLLSVGTYLQHIKADKYYQLLEPGQRLEFNKAIESLKPLYAPIFGLANALSNQTVNEVQVILADILRNFQKRELMAIMEKTIDAIGDDASFENLAFQLYMIAKSGDLLTVEVLSSAQLHLYWKLHAEERLKDSYLLQVAFYLNRVLSHAEYSKMDERLRTRMQQTIDSLPTALQLVFFRPHFCAQTINGRCQDLATKRWTRFALTNLNLYKSAGALHLQFNFADLNDRGNYGCMEFNSINFVLSQEGGRFSNWVLQLVNNNLVFSSYGLPLCTRYPKNLKYVSALASECHFVADDCGAE